MATDRTTLKKVFANDPITLKALEDQEKQEILQQQTELLKELVRSSIQPTKIEFLRGEDGETPEKGVDYFTEEEINTVAEQIKEVIKDEVRPIKGVDYFDGENGRDGSDGKSGKDGKNGVDGMSVSVDDVIKTLTKKKLPVDVIEGLFTEKDLEKYLKKNNLTPSALSDLGQRVAKLRADVERNYGGHGGSGGSPAMLYNLSSLLNGVTKSFTIPANTAISLVTGSSAPFIFAPTVDYTGSGTTTLTFTSNVDAAVSLNSGQTLIVQYY